MNDSIERTILIAAPIERVWDIVTTPEHIGRWFGDAGAEREGDVIKMRWEEHGEAELRVVRSDAPTDFAYRWDANVAGIGDTLVEFTLSTEGDRTRVTVVESGWTKLRTSAEEQTRLREGNVGGWEHEMADLERYAHNVAV
ncbi:SRPBCC domain-containing protein [Solirubrobacter ginsenosidimutans]|uniref:SRPBCC domain-containing protein n=1 Tax=Solirubrobacter ginsenosidimutans TaxID=490573 RepID=A0A9X3MW30_9ACTN|nr:SRPBCC domain-containing protein [Solirubrobacter ginsenosidimutans]MDA0162352.1 SRPBCC domain-containing protein [Solirubrobacter ginsenosidimutans]